MMRSVSDYCCDKQADNAATYGEGLLLTTLVISCYYRLSSMSLQSIIAVARASNTETDAH